MTGRSRTPNSAPEDQGRDTWRWYTGIGTSYIPSDDLNTLRSVLDKFSIFFVTLTWMSAACDVAYVYHCCITLDREVRCIWTKGITIGKILYLVTRYGPVIRAISNFIESLSRMKEVRAIGLCLTIRAFQWIATLVTTLSMDFTILLGLYAMLGGKHQIMWLLGILSCLYTLPFVATMSIENLAHIVLMISNPGFRRANVPRACAVQITAFLWDIVWTDVEWITILTWRMATTILGVYVIAWRYRGQENDLMRTIRRVGGGFYLSEVLTLTYHGFGHFPRRPPADESVAHTLFFLSQFSIRLRDVLSPWLCTKLILSLRRVDDPSLKRTISDLIFDVDENCDELDEVDGDEDGRGAGGGIRLGEGGFPDLERDLDIELAEMPVVGEAEGVLALQLEPESSV
ncbi:hypothetical protein DFP72DRAFT_926496 [Ephemerocybe angulata]|uniref:DUF6533 domain-containing protein n=1 Tax=Ephemerocybe angulata TaxID=980116 RepID=A0A8H6H6L5_9AGAR|nr:hypothetical protein DFP72DRAFT_949841 [Tulosesus angulatus]KAF6745274.1 hypothetical protein DFP72DRAFT_926496 [Tulosesus angulatus]